MTDSTCAVDGCTNPKQALGWCSRHYSRWMRKGHHDGRDTVRYSDPREALKARTRRDGDCIMWTASTNRSGYGQMWFQGKGWKAHRVAWYLRNGEIPQGMEIDHTCHKRGCVNVDHMRLTTRKQNMENLTGSRNNNKSGVRGVHRKGDKWRVVVGHNYQRHLGGTFDTLEEAEAVAIELRNKLFTHNDMDRAA